MIMVATHKYLGHLLCQVGDVSIQTDLGVCAGEVRERGRVLLTRLAEVLASVVERLRLCAHDLVCAFFAFS